MVDWPLTTPEGLTYPLPSTHPEYLVRLVAVAIEHPALSMGGPRHQSRQTAVRILKALEAKGLLSLETPRCSS